MKVSSAWWQNSFIFSLSQNNRRISLSATASFEEQLPDYHHQPLLQAASPIRHVSLHVTVLVCLCSFSLDWIMYSFLKGPPVPKLCTVTARKPKQFLTSKQSYIVSFSFLAFCHSRLFFYLCIVSTAFAEISEYYWLQATVWTALKPPKKTIIEREYPHIEVAFCDGFTVLSSHVPPSCLLPPHPKQEIGEENGMKKLRGWGKEKEITCQLLSQSRQTWLREN